MAKKYPSRIRNIFYFLENPEYPSLGPQLYLLGLAGLWRPVDTKYSSFKDIIFFLCLAFFFTQYCKCLIHLNTDSFKLILQYAPFHMGIVKSCFFQKYQKLWSKLIFYTAKVEQNQLSKNNKEFDDVINKYIGYNRKITYFFWTIAVFCNISIFTEPYQKNFANENGSVYSYLHIIDGYTPFKREPPGYYGAMFIETILGHFVSAYTVGWDTLVVSIMIFYAGQLRLARIMCKNIIDTKKSENSHHNITEFHRFYIKLIKSVILISSLSLIFSHLDENADLFYFRYQKLFNILISPVMFVYLVVISVNLGVCIINIIQTQNELASLFSSINYVVACLIQLLLFYWHANEVTVESTLVRYAVFEADWPRSERRIQKEVALLCFTTKKRMTFAAGPFSEMTLATFIMILRTSYSFYTLMKGTN